MSLLKERKARMRLPPPYMRRRLFALVGTIPVWLSLQLIADAYLQTQDQKHIATWLLRGLFAASFVPLIFSIWMLKRRLKATGGVLCPQCGYDMRGAEDERTVCPECGRPYDRKRDIDYWERFMQF